jgi:hypothetical protein
MPIRRIPSINTTGEPTLLARRIALTSEVHKVIAYGFTGSQGWDASALAAHWHFAGG